MHTIRNTHHTGQTPLTIELNSIDDLIKHSDKILSSPCNFSGIFANKIRNQIKEVFAVEKEFLLIFEVNYKAKPGETVQIRGDFLGGRNFNLPVELNETCDAKWVRTFKINELFKADTNNIKFIFMKWIKEDNEGYFEILPSSGMCYRQLDIKADRTKIDLVINQSHGMTVRCEEESAIVVIVDDLRFSK